MRLLDESTVFNQAVAFPSGGPGKGAFIVSMNAPFACRRGRHGVPALELQHAPESQGVLTLVEEPCEFANQEAEV